MPVGLDTPQVRGCLPAVTLRLSRQRPINGRRRNRNTGPERYSSSPVQGLQHLEASAIQVMLATKPVKILAAYLSPTRPFIVSGLSACLGGGLPVHMAGDLNAKHVEWNSRLITKRGSLLRNYADKNSCLIHGPNSPTIVPYNSSATPDVLDIVITRDLVSQCI
jgi:hypothetical protein